MAGESIQLAQALALLALDDGDRDRLLNELGVPTNGAPNPPDQLVDLDTLQTVLTSLGLLEADDWAAYEAQVRRHTAPPLSRVPEVEPPEQIGDPSSMTRLYCRTCWRENEIAHDDTDYHFCAHCGTRLTSAQAFRTAPFSQHENVGIIFLRMNGYQVDNDAEATYANLEAVRHQVRQVALSLGGYAKVMGDEAMLVFGTSGTVDLETARADNAMNVLRAVYNIDNRISEINRRTASNMHLTYGAHMGSVVAGVFGVTGEKQYDALGREVNFAARVAAQTTSTDHLLLSQQLYSAIQSKTSDIKLEAAGDVALKGFQGTHPVYRIKNIGALDSLPPPINKNGVHAEAAGCTRHESVLTPFCPSCGNQRDTQRTLTPQYRDVYVLSIDIAGFSTRAASMTPEQVVRWVNSFSGIAEPILARHYGAIIGRKGDEILVRFGIPSVGNNAINAVLAATDLRDALNLRNRGLPTGEQEIHFRIGVAYGPRTLVRGLDTVGGVVKRGALMQSQADRDGVQIDRETGDQIDPFFGTQGETRDGIAGYRVNDPKLEMIDDEQRRYREVPLVGREEQVRTIVQGFEQTRDQGIQSRLLTGEPGSGITSAANAFQQASHTPITNLTGHVTPWHHDPLQSVLRLFFERALSSSNGEFETGSMTTLSISTIASVTLTDAPAHEEVKTILQQLNVEHLLTGIAGEFPNLDDLASLVGTYLGIPVQETAAVTALRSGAPGDLRTWQARAVGLTLLGLSQNQPVILALHHVDQADPEALQFLGEALRYAETERNQQRAAGQMYVLLTANPQILNQENPRRDLVTNLTNYAGIPFSPLDQDQTGRLAAAVLTQNLIARGYFRSGEAPDVYNNINPQAANRLYQESDGNPLVIAELARTYFERGWLSFDHSQWGLTGATHASVSLDQIYQERLDELDPFDQSVFRAISVMAHRGGQFWREPLLSLIDAPEAPLPVSTVDELDTTLQRLELRGLIVPTISRIPEAREYQVISPQLADLAYSSMTRGHAQEIHTAAYNWLLAESTNTALPYNHTALTAYHAARAGRRDEALMYYLAAIWMAKNNTANADILSYTAEALEYIPDLSAQERFELLASRATVFARQVSSQEWLETIEAMELLVGETENPQQSRLDVVTRRLDYMLQTNNPDHAWIEENSAYIEAQDNLPPVALANYFCIRGATASDAGRYDAALQFFNRAQTLAQSVDDPRYQGRALVGKSLVHARRGSAHYEESHSLARQAIPLLERAGDQSYLANAYINLGLNFLNQNQPELAVKAFSQASTIARDIHDARALAYSLMNWGLAMALMRQHRQGVERINDMINEAPFSFRQNRAFLCQALYTRSFIVSFYDPRAGIRDARLAEHYVQGTDRYQDRTVAVFALAVAQYRDGDIGASTESLHRALSIRNDNGGNIGSYDEELVQFAALRYPYLNKHYQDVPNRDAVVDMQTRLASDFSLLTPLFSDFREIDTDLIERPQRGGVVVKTSEGLIQLGVPMWANKDALQRHNDGHSMPTVFVHVPGYNPIDGYLPFDFFTYNWFVNGNAPVTFVAQNADQVDVLAEYTRLAYLGDRDNPDLSREVLAEYPARAFGPATNLAGEIKRWFPTSRYAPDPDEMRHVRAFDEQGIYTHGRVTIRSLGHQRYEIIDDGTSLGVLNLKTAPHPEPILERSLEAFKDTDLQRSRGYALIEGRPLVWPLGTAGGFDTQEETSGHMHWNNGRVILVDPPSHTLEYFVANGLPLDLIDGVIITHGHTDHFGNGLFQLLNSPAHVAQGLRRVPLYTTRTIYRQLLQLNILAFGGLRGVDYLDLMAQYEKGLGEESSEATRLRGRYASLLTGDDPGARGVRIFVDLYLAARDNPQLVSLKQELDHHLAQLGHAGIFDLDFVELHPQERATINGQEFEVDYTLHPVPAIGFEIWQADELVLYYSGDTRAVADILWIMTQPGPGGAPPAMTMERALRVLRHYFYMMYGSRAEGLFTVLEQLTAHGPDGETPQLTGDTVGALLFNFMQSAQPNRDNRTVYLIDAGIPPVHIFPDYTQAFLLYLESKGVDTSNVHVFHLADSEAQRTHVPKWAPDHRGVIDLSEHYPERPALEWDSLLARTIGLVPLFDVVPREERQAFFQELVDSSTPRTQFAGERLLEAGSSSDEYLIIMDGEVEISRDGVVLAQVQSGLIGEGALLGEERNAIVIARVPTTVFRLSAEKTRELLKRYGIIQSLQNLRHLREISQNAFDQSPLRNLPVDVRTRLVMASEEVTFGENDYLVRREGTDRDMYLLLEGQVQVEVPTAAGANVLARFGPGDIVGEMAIITGRLRSADIRAIGNVRAFRFPEDQLEALAHAYPQIRGVLRRLTVERQQERDILPPVIQKALQPETKPIQSQTNPSSSIGVEPTVEAQVRSTGITASIATAQQEHADYLRKTAIAYGATDAYDLAHNDTTPDLRGLATMMSEIVAAENYRPFLRERGGEILSHVDPDNILTDLNLYHGERLNGTELAALKRLETHLRKPGTTGPSQEFIALAALVGECLNAPDLNLNWLVRMANHLAPENNPLSIGVAANTGMYQPTTFVSSVINITTHPGFRPAASLASVLR